MRDKEQTKKQRKHTHQAAAKKKSILQNCKTQHNDDTKGIEQQDLLDLVKYIIGWFYHVDQDKTPITIKQGSLKPDQIVYFMIETEQYNVPKKVYLVQNTMTTSHRVRDFVTTIQRYKEYLDQEDGRVFSFVIIELIDGMPEGTFSVDYVSTGDRTAHYDLIQFDVSVSEWPQDEWNKDIILDDGTKVTRWSKIKYFDTKYIQMLYDLGQGKDIVSNGVKVFNIREQQDNFMKGVEKMKGDEFQTYLENLKERFQEKKKKYTITYKEYLKKQGITQQNNNEEQERAKK